MRKPTAVTLALISTTVLLLPVAGWAGSNGSTPGQQIGSGGDIQFGDYIGIGLDAPYRYLIEVPPNTPTLVVEVLDADIGDQTGHRDEIGPFGGTFNTHVSYEVYDPDGVSAGTLACGPGTCAGANNAWMPIVSVSLPNPGHWLLVVDMSSAVTTGDDSNGYAVRAHDGDPTAGGTELNVYGQSFVAPGLTNLPDMAETDVYYPYVTSGCSFDSNEFDFDSQPAGDDNAIDFTSRSGKFTQHYSGLGPVSGNLVWQSNAVTGFVGNAEASDYGVWRVDYTIDDVGGSNDNWATVYIGTFDAAAPPPTSQPEADTHRLYLATDADTAPVKPWMGHRWSLVAGEPPPAPGVTSRLEVTLTLENPTAFPLQFDTVTGGNRSIVAEIPTGGAQVAYIFGSASIDSGGTSTAVSEAGTGPWTLELAPGVVAAGSSAVMTYRVDVTPAAPGFLLPITGTPAAGGTIATFLDETCADAAGGASACTSAAQSTATFTLGPLCELLADESIVFFDGFESGDTSVWSATVGL